MEDFIKILPVLSLLVAILAVLVGPLVSFLIAKKQIENSLAVSKKNIVAPIRQNWINELRKILSDITYSCAVFWTEGDKEARKALHLEIRRLIAKLTLYINPNEEDHVNLLALVSELEASMFGSDKNDEISNFWTTHQNTIDLAQKILKTEWERVKNEI